MWAAGRGRADGTDRRPTRASTLPLAQARAPAAPGPAKPALGARSTQKQRCWQGRLPAVPAHGRAPPTAPASARPAACTEPCTTRRGEQSKTESGGRCGSRAGRQRPAPALGGEQGGGARGCRAEDGGSCRGLAYPPPCAHRCRPGASGRRPVHMSNWARYCVRPALSAPGRPMACLYRSMSCGSRVGAGRCCGAPFGAEDNWQYSRIYKR